MSQCPHFCAGDTRMQGAFSLLGKPGIRGLLRVMEIGRDTSPRLRVAPATTIGAVARIGRNGFEPLS
jgi:hypothetical protein